MGVIFKKPCIYWLDVTLKCALLTHPRANEFRQVLADAQSALSSAGDDVARAEAQIAVEVSL